MATSGTRLLSREEYVEQAYFFTTLAERIFQAQSAQEALTSLREEVLASTRLPWAIDFLAGELRLHGQLAPAMQRVPHYFTPFQAFLVAEAEREGGRFDFRLALEVLAREASYRANQPTPSGSFLFQFETLCRNRLGYDRGLMAMSQDPLYDSDWSEWITLVGRQIGLIDLADLIYVRSQHYLDQRQRQGLPPDDPPRPTLFSLQEGKIALAHRRKDPLWLFATFARQLSYPTVPRPQSPDESQQLWADLKARLERLESRLRLIEEENQSGIDLSRFYGPPGSDAALDNL